MLTDSRLSWRLREVRALRAFTRINSIPDLGERTDVSELGLKIARLGQKEAGFPASTCSAKAQLEIRRSMEDRGPRGELVSTGDTPHGAGVRSTLPVVKEMLSWARREVMVVSYSLWIGSGDVGDIVDRLAQLSSSGVDVTLSWTPDTRRAGTCDSCGRGGRSSVDGPRSTHGSTRMTSWPSCTPRWSSSTGTMS